ncbi:hypothetical protein PFISCL1PPCAC_8112, partial [Pristionchus fissidentatus]
LLASYTLAAIITANSSSSRMERMEEGSESPRSIRSYHKGGSGTLTGGGVQKIYSGSNAPNLKEYKRKLDSRLGQCILLCLITLATLLCLYGFIHGAVHEPLYTYVNRTHQIVHELENAVEENFGGVRVQNETLEREKHSGKKWLTSEELMDYSQLLTKTRSTIWHLFGFNLVLAFILAVVLFLIHFADAEGTYVKFLYRGVLVVCLIFHVAQFLFLLHPCLVGAFTFPSMVDRLFVEAYPRDEYQIRGIEESFSCQFNPNPYHVEFNLASPCLLKMKNSTLPAYGVILMMLITLVPFAFAAFTYAWSACIKDKKHVVTARRRVELNNKRRVPIPNHPPEYSMSSPPQTRRANPEFV